VAGLYVVLEAEFLAVAQVLIYVGAIATLIVFAIMLSRGMMMGRTAHLNDQWVVAAVGAFALFIALTTVVRSVSWPVVEAAVPPDAIARVGELLVTDYVIPFEAASVLLLVALIGAIIIARETDEEEDR
jgi:NAD(P)H-quinone oxidoreductase subunit 6